VHANARAIRRKPQ